MIRKFVLIGASALGLAALTTLAVAQSGLWPNLPIVGSAAYSCGTTNGVSTCTVPAGPTALTGTENIPANTNYSGGQSPQNVLVPVTMFASGAGSLQVVTTNTSVEIANGVSTLVSNQGTATIASIKMPSAPMNNQIVRIVNAGSGVLTITALSANTGQSLVQGAAPATLAIQTTNSAAAAVSSVEYIYRASNTTWYRIQ